MIGEILFFVSVAVFRGYKIQFESSIDMDITKTDKESAERLVNINTIKWSIYNGVKYIVK